MLKTLKLGRKSYYGVLRSEIQKRLFLSESYRCDEAWKARLDSPILQKIKPKDLFYQIDQRFGSKGAVHAIDVDIFVNTANNSNDVNEILSALRNLRLSPQTSNTLESTHHAVTRFMLDNDHHEELLTMLHDRIQYGIFPDNVCYNLLMDTFIKNMQYGHAARVAVLPMLQEDLENPITNALAIYSCHKYLDHVEQWQKPTVPEPDEDEEEIKVRVAYLRNPYFDDHFDLVDPFDLVGKTLAFGGKQLNNALGRSCQLRGLVLYKKYDDAIRLMKKWINEVQEDIVYNEVFHFIERDSTHITNDEVLDDLNHLKAQLNQIKSKQLCYGKMMEHLENNVKSAIKAQAENDIMHQCKAYVTWEEARAVELDKQTKELDKQARLENIEKIKKDLEERERILTFFDRQEDIELEIEKKDLEEAEERARVAKIYRSEKKLRKLTETEAYIPPEI